MKEKKLKLQFKTFLIFYACLLGLIMVGFLIHVFDSLVKYEKNQTENFINKTLENLCKKDSCEINDLAQIEKGPFDKEESINLALKNLLEKADLEYEESENSQEENPTYLIKANNQEILEIQLKSEKKLNRLGLLSFCIWDDAEVRSKIDKGFYLYNITVPNNFKVYLNNKELTNEQIKEGEQNEGMLEMAKYVSIPYNVKYQIENLYFEPEIKILDENNHEVNYEQHGYTIEIKKEFKKIENLEEAKKEIESIPEILKMAEQWSLFLTNDLKGTLHGFHQINAFLIDDSTLSKFAKNWATGIDITFTSKHTFDNPIFTGENIRNFEIYDEDAFSCEVYLEKNMIIKGKKHQDVMHDRMYFVKIDKEWKLVNMQAITG